MQTSRMWEAVVASAAQQSSTSGMDPYFNRSFSSGRVAFSVPSNYFDSLANRSVVESATIDSLTDELLKIEEYYMHQLREGRRPAEIDEKVRTALVHKISELRTSSAAAPAFK